MKIITKSVHIALSYFPVKIQRILRALLPLSMKRSIGKSLMHDAVGENRIVEVIDGRQFKVIEDRLFLRVLYEKSYEPILTAVASKLVKKGDNVVDVGANFGWYTTLFGRLVGSGAVTSYEPAPHSYRILEENIELNDMSSVINLRKVGVGAESGAFFLEPGSSSESGLAHVVDEESNTTIRTPIVTLDEDLQKLTGNIAYLKIDIEGLEYSAVQGAKSLLKVPNQPIIQIELNNEALIRGDSSRVEIVEFLTDLGYSFYEVVAGSRGKLKKSTAKKCSDAFCFGSGIYASRLNNIIIS